VQVVDRFHLVHNLRQALEAFLIDHRPALQAAAVGTAMALTPPPGPIPVTPMYRGRRRSPKPAQPREGTTRTPRHAVWVAIYEAVRTLRAQGMPLATIARQLGISGPTVYDYLRRDTPPGPRRFQWRPSARLLTPYIPYVIRRWRESRGKLCDARCRILEHANTADEGLPSRTVAAQPRNQLLIPLRYAQVQERHDLTQVAGRLFDLARDRLAIVDIKGSSLEPREAEIAVAAENVVPGQPVDEHRGLFGERGIGRQQHLLRAAQHPV